MSIKEHVPPQSRAPKEYELHVPVLLDATLDILQPKRGESYLDLTAGYGGHAEAFLEQTDNFTDSVLVDRDDCATFCRALGFPQVDPVAQARSVATSRKTCTSRRLR